MSPVFAEKLAFGKIAESHIAMWLRKRCKYAVLPVYEKEINEGKGPQLYLPDDSLIAPDMVAIRGDEIKWIEAKHKTVFSWHRKTERWVTGIDIHHYEHYLTVNRKINWPIYLMFFHRQAEPNHRDIDFGSPQLCPTGLFCGCLDILSENENHRARADQWGKGGMVYWAHEILMKLADYDEVVKCSET